MGESRACLRLRDDWRGPEADARRRGARHDEVAAIQVDQGFRLRPE